MTTVQQTMSQTFSYTLIVLFVAGIQIRKQQYRFDILCVRL